MDVILHLGAHRTGSTSFQDYMQRAQSPRVAFWGPRVTRGGLLDGVQGSPLGSRPGHRAKGRIAVQLAALEARGVQTLVISDENLIGPMRSNLRCATLYPEIGLRLARLYTALGGRITRVALQIRALDTYWASVLAFGLSRSVAVPSADLRRHIVAADRRWQDVITDLACAMPDVPIDVTVFESHVLRPDLVAALATGRTMPPMPALGIWTNRRMADSRLRACLAELNVPDAVTLFHPDGAWQPFSPMQRYTLRAQTAADLAWLRRGADGLAHLHEHAVPNPAVRAGAVQKTIRGSEDYDSQDRHMARPC